MIVKNNYRKKLTDLLKVLSRHSQIILLLWLNVTSNIASNGMVVTHIMVIESISAFGRRMYQTIEGWYHHDCVGRLRKTKITVGHLQDRQIYLRCICGMVLLNPLPWAGVRELVSVERCICSITSFSLHNFTAINFFKAT